MRNKRELGALREGMRRWQTRLLYLDHEISARASGYVEEYFLSQSLKLADALIGATAITHRLPLLTGDTRHYEVIGGLEIRRFRPVTAV